MGLGEETTHEGIRNTNISETTYCTTFSKILKGLIFILAIPVIVSGGIIIALVTMVIGVLLNVYYLTPYRFTNLDLQYLWGNVKDTVTFVKKPFIMYAYLIRKLFCCGDEERESWVLSMFCRGVGMVVAVVVIFLTYFVLLFEWYFLSCVAIFFLHLIIIIGFIDLIGLATFYLLYLGTKKICKKIGKCYGTRS